MSLVLNYSLNYFIISFSIFGNFKILSNLTVYNLENTWKNKRGINSFRAFIFPPQFSIKAQETHQKSFEQ